MKTTSRTRQTSQGTDPAPERPSPEHKHERTQRVLKHGATALVRSISGAVVIKNQDLFFLTEPDGSVPLKGAHGFGLYYHDCRFLCGYKLDIANTRPDVLASNADAGFRANLYLTNPDLRMADGRLIRKEEIGIRWTRMLDQEKNALYDTFTWQNFSMEPVEFQFALTFDAQFDDLFQVRGAEPDRRGTLHAPAWEDNVLSFIYDGADGLYRSLSIYFSPHPGAVQESRAEYHISLKPRESKEIKVSLVIAESTDPHAVKPKEHYRHDLNKIASRIQRSSDEWVQAHSEILTNSIIVNQVLNRSLRDLAVLRSSIAGQDFYAAGLPWFATLFGRDSLITALQTIAWNPAVAQDTLRVLARYQGQRVDEWRDEEPGKILHELRVGEMAHLNEIPQTPYYGSVDATPLFLILMARQAAWTGNLDLFNEMRGHVDRALEWIDRYGDQNGDGYVEYASKSKGGLSNQGWKDSGDSVSNSDGSLAQPPIALVEVQGYVYRAKQDLAELYERAGDVDQANRLRQQAEDLRKRFNHDFWMAGKKFYALALQAKGRQADIISSNPGQALWTGIVDEVQAESVASRLMAPDMFGGWGIRTLGEQEARYNPIGYHLGTVWPHDNALIAAGLRRYGYDDEFCTVFTALVEAAMGFRFYRLPELFAGFPREEYRVPVRYPVACHPQAWAAGTVPFLMENLLGLVPEAFENRLRVVRPIMPDMLDHIEIHRLQVGRARLDLNFDKTPDGVVAVDVRKIEGDLDVMIEAPTPRTSNSQKGNT